MIRRAFTMRLKPDSLTQYKHHHDNIWPELVAEIERSGIASITTFQRDLDLFLISEIADEAAWEKLWNSEVHKRWAELMQPLMHLRDDGIVDAGELSEVFHLTINDNGRISAAVEIAEPVNDPVVEAMAEVEAALDQLNQNPAVAAESAEPTRKRASRKTKKSAVKKAAGKKKAPAKKVHRNKAGKSPRPKTRGAAKATKKAAKKPTKKKAAPKGAKKAAKKKPAKKKR